jgi:hypothetical protein
MESVVKLSELTLVHWKQSLCWLYQSSRDVLGYRVLEMYCHVRRRIHA